VQNDLGLAAARQVLTFRVKSR